MVSCVSVSDPTFLENDFTIISLPDARPDRAFPLNEGTYIRFSTGAGISYTSPQFTIGLSVPQINQTKIYESAEADHAHFERHYLLFSSVNFRLNYKWKLIPTVLVRYTSGVPASFDITSRLVYRDIVQFGIFYRQHESFGGLLSFKVNKYLQLAYSYDYPTSALSAFTNGTHELTLFNNIKIYNKRIRSPRHF